MTSSNTKIQPAFPDEMTEAATDRDSRQESQSAHHAFPEQLVAVPLTQLAPNPWQPRSTADEEKLEELVTAIAQEGLIQPIAVRTTSEGAYQVIAGHRRVAAFQRLYERTKGTDQWRQYEAIPAIVKAPLDDLRMATTAFIENDKREKLNLVDEAAALAKIRDILSASLAREATAKEVADAVGKKDEQRVSRLLRFHEAPDVVKEGVVGHRLVRKDDAGDGSLVKVVRTSTRGQKTIDLHAALEFSRLHRYFAATAPAKADERAKRIIDRAREEGWSLRRIQGYVKAIVSGTAKLPSERRVFFDDSQRLTVYLPRLASASPEVRAELRIKLRSVLDEIDRLGAPSEASSTAAS